MNMPNNFAKTRDIENPYATYRVDNPDNGMYFEWRVLKAWQTRESEKKKPYGRWFCAVKSPMTYGSWEMGDVYANEILEVNPKLIQAEAQWIERMES
jgi:hypothetical protein